MLILTELAAYGIELWLFVLGAIFGSYAVALVWRLRAQQLFSIPPSNLTAAEHKEYLQLVCHSHLDQVRVRTDYSRCLHCQHRLAWSDLVPIISWLRLKGRCRYCNQPIGWTEFLAELSLAGLFAWSYVLNQSTEVLVVWLGLLVVLTILFIYDAKWQLLPTKLLWLAIGLASILAALEVLSRFQAGQSLGGITVQYISSLVLMSGLYWFLATVSRQTWVGSGDSYVGAVVGLVLGNIWLSAVALFLANLLGCVVIFVIAILTKKNIRRLRVAFGPMLIMALLIVYFCRALILQKVNYLMFDI